MAKPTFTAGTVLVAAKLTQIADLLWGSDGWQVPTLLNGWVAYGVGTAAAPTYRKHAGTVYVQGVVMSGTAATIMQLPVGYRPANRLYFVTPCSNSAGTDGSWSQVDVLANGEIQYSHSGGDPTKYVSISLCFTAEA